MVPAVIPFGSVVADSADLSKLSAGVRDVCGIRYLSTSYLALAPLSCHMIEASCIFSSCKRSIILLTESSFI